MSCVWSWNVAIVWHCGFISVLCWASFMRLPPRHDVVGSVSCCWRGRLLNTMLTATVSASLPSNIQTCQTESGLHTSTKTRSRRLLRQWHGAVELSTIHRDLLSRWHFDETSSLQNVGSIVSALDIESWNIYCNYRSTNCQDYDKLDTHTQTHTDTHNCVSAVLQVSLC